MKKTLIGKNENGTDRYHYEFDGPEGGGLLFTGPISGTIVLKDGTPFNLSDELIEHGPGQAGPIHHHIEKLHERTGAIPGFKHTCSDDCGDEAEVIDATTAVIDVESVPTAGEIAPEVK